MGESEGLTEPSASTYTVPLHALTHPTLQAGITINKSNTAMSTPETRFAKDSSSPASRQSKYQRSRRNNVSGIIFYDPSSIANAEQSNPHFGSIRSTFKLPTEVQQPYMPTH